MDISNKVCLVTGATAGLGKALAIALANLGAKVIITSRNQSAGEAVVSEIKNQTGNQQVSLLVVDFSSQKSIKKAAVEFRARHSALHLLINCAAIYKQKRELTEDGLESMFAVNHLGYFLLTVLLLDLLKSSAPSRILNVTAPSTTKLNFDDLLGEKKFRSLWAFGASKMANLLFTFALARRLEGRRVTTNAIHPGLMKTNLMLEAFAPIRWILKIVSQPPAKAAESIIEVAVAPEYADKNGLFFHRGKAIKSSDYAYDKEVQERLWDVSLKLTGLE